MDHRPSSPQLRAPRRSGERLIVPALDAATSLLARNIASREASTAAILGRSIVDLAKSARSRLIVSASRYTRQYRDVADVGNADRVVLAGHQPELFHPGVWFKHFVLNALARRNGAVAINLIVDNDTARQTSIRVPAGPVERPSVEMIPFDAPAAVVAWEERAIVDRVVFNRFATHVAERFATLSANPRAADPLIVEMWPLAVRAASRCDRLGFVAEARHVVEGQLGLATMEVPLSEVCRGEEFTCFVCWLLSEAPRVRDVYNGAIGEYRLANRIRNASHPAPDLAADAEWCETPLWVWSREQPRRRHLFVTRAGNRMVLSDREGWTSELPSPDGGSPAGTIERLANLETSGVRIRPRALITTLFSRMFLSDLFVHGIGRAEYDEVTDVIIERLWSRTPPAFLTATATLHLPIDHPRGADEAIRADRRRARNLAFHPEIVGRSDDAAWRAAAADKQHWIAEYRQAASHFADRSDAAAWAAARRRHLGFVEANARLAAWTNAESRAIAARQATLREAARAEAILSSREYAFCLFPRETLQQTLRLT